jgi:hypothetical protein
MTPVQEKTGKILSVAINTSAIHIDAEGSPEYLCAVGQQLAWLGAVCHFTESKPCYCDTLWSRTDSTRTISKDTISFEITYEIVPFDKNEIEMCWHRLIEGATVATGFPVPSRSIENRGLQVPLDIMAALVGSSVAVDTGSGYFIRGEACALYPVDRSKDRGCIQWHLVEDRETPGKDDDSTNLPSPVQYKRLTMKEIQSTTAYLGWTPGTLNCAGNRKPHFRAYSRIINNLF